MLETFLPTSSSKTIHEVKGQFYKVSRWLRDFGIAMYVLCRILKETVKWRVAENWAVVILRGCFSHYTKASISGLN